MCPDSIRSVLREALAEKVLVLKVTEGRSTKYLKNPDERLIRELLAEERLEFQRLFLPKDPFRAYPYCLQFHIRGSSVHVDFRHGIGNGLVSGETITVNFGLPRELQKHFGEAVERAAKRVLGTCPEKEEWDAVPLDKRVQVAKLVEVDWDRAKEVLLEKWKPDFLSWERKKPFVAKALQDESWESLDRAVFAPGTLGATRYEWAFLLTFDRGLLEYGVQKPEYREYWLDSETGLISGKLNFTYLPREQVAKTMPDEDSEGKLGRGTWVGLCFPSKVQQPYMLSPRCVEDDYLPPPGFPALPKRIRDLVPGELRYWEGRNRRQKRDMLVDWAKENLEFYERRSPEDVPSYWARRKRHAAS